MKRISEQVFARCFYLWVICMMILPYKREYLSEISGLLYESVHTLCREDYTESELETWVPKNMDMKKLAASFSSEKTFVVVEDEKVLAFADMDRDGYLNRLYTRPGYEGKGIGRMLLTFMEKRAKAWGNPKMALTSSVSARPFYEKCGYTVKRKKKRKKCGETLLGFVMIKEF